MVNLNIFDVSPDDAAVLAFYIICIYVPFVTIYVWRINRKVDDQIAEAEEFRNKLARLVATQSMPKSPEGLVAWSLKPVIEAMAARVAKVDVQAIVERELSKAQAKVTQNGKTTTEPTAQGSELLSTNGTKGAEEPPEPATDAARG